MKATDQALVRVELLLRCWGGGSAVESIALVISDSPVLLALLEKHSGVDDFMPLELYSELSFEPASAALHGYFNRAAGYRLRETLEEGIGKHWRWLPPRRRRNPWYSGSAGRVIIPSQRLWFAWDDGKPHPACAQDIQAFAEAWPPVDGTQGFCNDRLLVMHVTRSVLDGTEAGAQQELLRLVTDHFFQTPQRGVLDHQVVKTPQRKLSKALERIPKKQCRSGHSITPFAARNSALPFRFHQGSCTPLHLHSPADALGSPHHAIGHADPPNASAKLPNCARRKSL